MTLILLFLSFTVSSPVQLPITVPISKPKMGTLTHTSSIRAAQHRFLRNPATSVPLENRFDTFFQANVTIGTNQTFKIDLDTGSSDFWVRGPNCKSDDWSCIGKKVSLPDSSLKPLGKQFSTVYGSGSVTADIYSANVNIGGAVAKDLPFGVSTKEASFMGITGLLGLGFNSISDISNSTGLSASYFDALGYTGENNKFSFYLSLYGDNDNGEVTLGGVDPTKFTGAINYVPLSGETWWKFDFGQVTYSVGSISGPASSKKYSTDAISDTGTTLIILGEDVANAINKEVGASNYDSDSGTYSIDCSIQNTGPPLTFNFPGFAISIPAKFYVISDYDSNCISAITQGAGPRVPNVL
ncbi:Vacuolar protease A [Boothiomyces macroporosus]|uniref:Vacuolar protease A n=1 Tax=Boothiomyces macroporosus TaxID=261099 RepID=A0AAD5Y696_9FUNG|nr:Vacuolar protease A [Boothiomyces macroporosus]